MIDLPPSSHRYDASVQLLLAETGTTGKLRDDQIHTPPLMSSTYAADYDAFKVRLKKDDALRAQIRANNAMDIELYGRLFMNHELARSSTRQLTTFYLHTPRLCPHASATPTRVGSGRLLHEALRKVRASRARQIQCLSFTMLTDRWSRNLMS